MFAEFDSIKNSGCHGNQMEFFKEFFKNLLLWKCWSDFEIVSQDCSLGDPFQKLFAKFWSIKKHGCHGGGFLRCVDLKKFFKNRFLWNCWSEFGIILQDCSLCYPFQILFIKFWSVEKHGRHGGGGDFLHCVDLGLIFRNSPLKLLVGFWNNFTGLFLGWPFSKSVHEILIRRKTWPPWGETFCTLWT